ncbi:MAG: hypothetical protein R2747_18535 [Pyrinomonadaceae bacterium]
MLENEFLLTNDFSFVNEEFYTLEISPRQMDILLSHGWRHFGTHFFRYSIGIYGNQVRRVIPLRIRLEDFTLSKSLRRIIKKNSDLQPIIRPVFISSEKEELFEHHKCRFNYGIPGSIYDFLSFSPSNVPGEALEISVYRAGKLIAASFFDVSERAVSGIYAMFDTEESARSLGIFTMLLEIEFARLNGKAFYYQGYCYEGNSFYDYKKRFRATEQFDWKGNWKNFENQNRER